MNDHRAAQIWQTLGAQGRGRRRLVKSSGEAAACRYRQMSERPTDAARPYRADDHLRRVSNGQNMCQLFTTSRRRVMKTTENEMNENKRAGHHATGG